MPGESHLNSPIVRLLEQLLAGAKSGKVTSIAAIVVGPMATIETPAAGGQLAEMNLGVDILKLRLIAAVDKPSPVLRPT